jgi:hypothetical protein
MNEGTSGAERDHARASPPRDTAPPPARDEVDEPPGAYLAELGARGANIAWGAVNLALVLALGTLAALVGIPGHSPWHALSRLVWSLIPISSLILLVVTAWQAANSYASPSAGKTTASFALALASIALWLIFRYGLQVLPPA